MAAIADGAISRVANQPRDTYLRLYNPGDLPLTATAEFEASATQRWSTTITIPPHARLNVPVAGVVPVPASGQTLAFGAKVTFEPGRVGVVSFLVYSEKPLLYLYMVPTLFCQAP